MCTLKFFYISMNGRNPLGYKKGLSPNKWTRILFFFSDGNEKGIG